MPEALGLTDLAHTYTTHTLGYNAPERARAGRL